MGYFGILPTPNSPKIASTNMNMYVKRSFYPIPYQVVCAIESCNVDSISSWDINVTDKNIKVKVQYDLKDKVLTDSDDVIFPKAVINSIKTYNIVQPTWSTSCNQKKLCLKIDWKLISPSQDSSYVSPSTFSTPQNSGSKSYPDSSNIVDSGYMSLSSANILNSHRYVNKVNLPGSPVRRTKLFQSPRKEFVQHDIYRPGSKPSNTSAVQNISSKISTSKNSIDTNRVNESIGRVSNDTGSQISPTDSPDLDDYSSSALDPTCHSQPPSSQPLNPTSQPSLTPQPSQSQDPPTQSHDLTPQYQDQTSQSSQPSHPPISKPTLPNPTQILTSFHQPDSSLNPSLHNPPSPPRSDESNDKPIFDPVKRLFWPCPNPLEVFDDGFLDDELDAYYMDIIGICRLCGDEVPSYLCELHLLECCELERDEVYEFYQKVATEIYSLSENIMDYAKEFCYGTLTATSSPPEDFPNKDSYQNFLRGLDQLFESLTSKVFDELCIHDYRSRFNILKYHPKHSHRITL